MENLFSGMIAAIGVNEVIWILLSLGMWVATLIGIVALIWWLLKRSGGGGVRPRDPEGGKGGADGPSTATSVDGTVEVRTHCPKCGTPMASGSAQGLCPRCLMAVGMGTQPAPAGSEPGGAGGGGVAMDVAELGARFPHLEIMELIGQGGMGMVYRVRQRKLDRVVALKVLSREAAKDPAFAERFNREARALARLNHPNIVTVYDFGEADGLFYLVMELVDGADLRRVLEQGRLSPEEALRIVPVVCDALQYAHANGVVHRDIKPGNILMDREGRVKIADFGIAKLAGQAGGDVTLTQSKQSMGTPHYMAPEQVESPQTVDHRADIYSLGVVFYEMLTGELPLGRFAPPSRRVQVDVRLDEVVLRALEKEPGRRYQQAGDVRTEVERITGSPASVPWPGAPITARGVVDGISKAIAEAKPVMWLGLVWTLFFLVAVRITMDGTTSGEALPLVARLFGYLGALAPLGVTVLGWVALRAADRRERSPRELRQALVLHTVFPLVILGFISVCVMMGLLHDVFRIASGSGVGSLVFCVLVTLTGLALLANWVRSRWLVWAIRDPRSRPRAYAWLPVAPTAVALLATVFIWLILLQTEARRHRAKPAMMGMSVAEPALLGSTLNPDAVPFPVVTPVGAGAWEASTNGPVLEEGFASETLGLDATQRGLVDKALQGAERTYIEKMKGGMAQVVTNAVGHRVLLVRGSPQVMDAIENAFWTEVDAILDGRQQAILRGSLRLRISRSTPVPSASLLGMAEMNSLPALLPFGHVDEFFEFWQVGRWFHYRFHGDAERAMRGDAMPNAPDLRGPALPEDYRRVVELVESKGAREEGVGIRESVP